MKMPQIGDIVLINTHFGPPKRAEIVGVTINFSHYECIELLTSERYIVRASDIVDLKNNFLENRA